MPKLTSTKHHIEDYRKMMAAWNKPSAQNASTPAPTKNDRPARGKKRGGKK